MRGAGPCTPTPRDPIPVLWTPEGPQGIAGGPRAEGVGGLGGEGELLTEEASLRCWSRGLGGGGEGRTEKVLRRGIGEPGGKTTWEGEKRDRDEDDDGGGDSILAGRGSRGLSLLASGVRPVSRGHRTAPPPPHPAACPLARAGEEPEDLSAPAQPGGICSLPSPPAAPQPASHAAAR